ncbi:MAG: putative Ig domain-containing protein, partial [Verrucomicrobia bacterium]|nr:putative Ig domain-containing protein [Verrucomicrobiota bacterium]
SVTLSASHVTILSNGTWNAVATGSILNGDSTALVASGGVVNLGSYLSVRGPLTNAGTINLTTANQHLYLANNGTALYQGGLVNQVGGRVNFSNTGGISGQFGQDYLINRGELTKVGTAANVQIAVTSFSNEGQLTAQHGQLRVDQATLQAAGSLNVGLSSLTDAGQIVFTGSSQALAGGLGVSLLNGFVPAVGNRFQAVSCSSRSGVFSSINAPGFSVTYSNNGVFLTYGGVLAITTSSPLPAGAVGQAYSQSLTAVGGTLPYTWALAAGSLLAGLGLTNGVISGMPSAAGTATFTVRVTDSTSLSATNDFSLTIRQNNAPVLEPIANTNVSELTLLSFTAAASDPDPSDTRTFSLLAPPSGAAIGTNTGVFTWTPTEAQGPSNYVVRVVVTDNGIPSLSATQSCTVTVNEVNRAPVLSPIADTNVSVLALVSFTVTARDDDLPPNALSFALLAGPAGAAIAPDTGLFTWMPTEAQSVSNHLVSVVVSDNGVPNLSATQSFRITVTQAFNDIYAFTNYVGEPGLAGSADGAGNAAKFRLPYGVAVDSAGNVFVADEYNHTIRKVTPDKVVTTLAGRAGSFGSADGTGGGARFKCPAGLALDRAGHLYVADYYNHTIRKVTPAGEVSTLAGSAEQVGSADGSGSAARFNRPVGLAVDSMGNVFVADSYNHTIRKLTPGGDVTTFAGSPGVSGTNDGPGNAARFYLPSSVGVDSADNILVVDSYNHTIRQITPAGVVTTFAGSPGQRGIADGTGSAARFDHPSSLAVDSADNLYLTDHNSTIRKVTLAGVVTTLAGSPGEYGAADGLGSAARFYMPYSVAVDGARNLYVADSFNHRITKGTPCNVPAILTPSPLPPGLVGAAYRQPLAASGTPPCSWTVTVGSLPAGLVLSSDGIISGTPSAAGTATFTVRAANFAGLAASSDFSLTIISTTCPIVVTGDRPGLAGTTVQMAYDGNRNTYFRSSYYDWQNIVIDRGCVGTFSGLRRYMSRSNNTNGVRGGQGEGVTWSVDGTHWSWMTGPTSHGWENYGNYGAQLHAWMSVPYGWSAWLEPNQPIAARYICFTWDGDGDWLHEIELRFAPLTALAITTLSPLPTGVVGTAYHQPLAVSGGAPPYTWTLAAGSLPAGLTLTNGAISGLPSVVGSADFSLRVSDGAGLSDTRAFSLAINPRPAGVYAFTNFAGLPEVLGSADGTGAAAQFDTPVSTAADAAGNVYVADYYNHTIRKITPAGVVTTFAGSPGLTGTNDGTGDAARFNQPAGVAADSAGNVFVTDRINHTIRKITPAGEVTTFAGSPGISGTNDGTGFAARFYVPYHLAVDATGNVFVADHANYTIRKITSARVVTTLAGCPHIGGTNDGAGGDARFSQMSGVAVDAAGNVFVGDSGNHTLRKITPDRVVSTLAGSPGIIGTNDGVGCDARFRSPAGVVVDFAGNVLVADSWNHAIRKVTPAGVVTTVGSIPGHAGTADGVGAAARFNHPIGVALDAAGNLFVADARNHRITKGTPWNAPAITTSSPLPAGMAGEAYSVPLAASSGTPPYTWALASGSLPADLSLSSDGVISGTPSAAGTATFSVRVTDSVGLFASKEFSLTISPAPPSDVYAFTNLAGLPDVSGSADGLGTAARFDSPTSTAVDQAGNVFVADYYNHTIRKVTPAGDVTTFAGSPGLTGTNDGAGAEARFNLPAGVAVDRTGHVFVTDRKNHTIRMITPDGVVTTFAGSPGVPGTNDGTGSAARFYVPYHLAVDQAGNVFVADHANYTIRKITPDRVVTTLAGCPRIGGTNDGAGSAARFSQMCGVAVDAAGNVFVGDTINHTIRKITPEGVVSTLAGCPGVFGPDDGTGSEARFRSPSGVVVDAAGNVLVADSWNHAIRKVTPAGVVTTVGSIPGHVGAADGVGAAARFHHPKGLALDAAGNLYVADALNHRITKGTPFNRGLNHPPTIAPIANTNLAELATLRVTARASDPDWPPNRLTFSLLDPPPGAVIDPDLGIFTWTVPEALLPNTSSNYLVQVVVSDDGTPSLSATQSFVVTVYSPDLVNVQKWLPEALADGQADWPTYANAGGAPLFTLSGVSNAWFKVYHSGWRLCLLAGDLPVEMPKGPADHLTLLIRPDRYAGPTVSPAEYRFKLKRDGTWSAERGTTNGTFAPISVPAEDVTVATVTNGDEWTLEVLLNLEWFGGYGRYGRCSLMVETPTGQPLIQWPDGVQAGNPTTWGRWILLPTYPHTTSANAVAVAGHDGYLVVPNTPELNPAEITVEAWVQIPDEASGGTLVGNGRAQSFWFGLHDQLLWSINGESLPTRGPTTVKPVQWHHVAATVASNGARKLYLDGRQDAQFASGKGGVFGALGAPFQVQGSDRHLRLGSDRDTASATENLRAWICDLRIWNYPRSATQIRDNALSTLTGSEAGLVGWWPFTNGLRDVVGGNDAGRMGKVSMVKTAPPSGGFESPALVPYVVPPAAPRTPWDGILPATNISVTLDAVGLSAEYDSAARIGLEPGLTAEIRAVLTPDGLALFSGMLLGGVNPADQLRILIDRTGAGGSQPAPQHLRLRVQPNGNLTSATGDGSGFGSPGPASITNVAITTDRSPVGGDILGLSEHWWCTEVFIPYSALAPFQPGDPLRLAVRYQGLMPPNPMLSASCPASFDELRPDTWLPVQTQPLPGAQVGLGSAAASAAPVGVLADRSGAAAKDLAGAPNPAPATGAPTADDFACHCPVIDTHAPDFGANYEMIQLNWLNRVLSDNRMRWPQVDPTNQYAAQAVGVLKSSHLVIQNQSHPQVPHFIPDLYMQLELEDGYEWLSLSSARVPGAPANSINKDDYVTTSGGKSLLLILPSDLPVEARPQPGDRVTVTGPWVFECGGGPRTAIALREFGFLACDRTELRPVWPNGQLDAVKVVRIWAAPRCASCSAGPYEFEVELPDRRGDWMPFIRFGTNFADRAYASWTLSGNRVRFSFTFRGGAPYFFVGELMIGYLKRAAAYDAQTHGPFTITFNDLYALDDKDRYGPGDWFLSVNALATWGCNDVNGASRHLLWNDAVEGNVTRPWPSGTTLALAGSELTFFMSAFEEDGIYYDGSDWYQDEACAECLTDWLYPNPAQTDAGIVGVPQGNLANLAAQAQPVTFVGGGDYTFSYTVSRGGDLPSILMDEPYWASRLANEPNDTAAQATWLGTLPVPLAGGWFETNIAGYVTEVVGWPRGQSFPSFASNRFEPLEADVDWFTFGLDDFADIQLEWTPTTLLAGVQSSEPDYGIMPATVQALDSQCRPVLTNTTEALGYCGGLVQVASSAGKAGDVPYTLTLRTRGRQVPLDWGECADTAGGRLLDLTTSTGTPRVFTADWAWQHTANDVDYYVVRIPPLSPPPGDAVSCDCSSPGQLSFCADGTILIVTNLTPELSLVGTNCITVGGAWLRANYPAGGEIVVEVRHREFPNRRGIYQFTAIWEDTKYCTVSTIAACLEAQRTMRTVFGSSPEQMKLGAAGVGFIDLTQPPGRTQRIVPGATSIGSGGIVVAVKPAPDGTIDLVLDVDPNNPVHASLYNDQGVLVAEGLGLSSYLSGQLGGSMAVGQEWLSYRGAGIPGMRSLAQRKDAGSEPLYYLQLTPVNPLPPGVTIQAPVTVQTVELDLTPARPTLSDPRVSPEGVLTLEVGGQPGARYRVEVSDDLQTWSELITFESQSAVTTVTDFLSDLDAQRFYRAAAVP